MDKEKKYTLDQAHHYFGVAFNNIIFKITEKPSTEVTAEEKLLLVSYAHASLLHWHQFSGSKLANRQRALYMIAKAYVFTGDKINALKYASKCRQLTQNNQAQLADFDLAYAHEMMARVYAMHDNEADFKTEYAIAQEQAALIKSKGDKEFFDKDFEAGPWFAMTTSK